MMKIGFIGLGIMGRPMALNLIRGGHQLVVWQKSGAAEELVAAGAQTADSYSELAAGVELVILMLPDSPQVEQVVLGEQGVLQGINSGTILVDMSSIAPAVSQSIACELEKKKVAMLDAPVSGGEPGAIAGTLSIMVGGPEAAFESVKEVLLCMGKSAVRCGGIGAGNTTKLANQIIVALNIAALSEALVLGKKAGVDPQVIMDAIRGGLAGSAVLEAKGPMMAAGSFDPGFRLDLHMKDLNNVLDTAKTLDLPLFLTAQVQDILRALHNGGKGDLDHSGIVTFYEQLTGLRVADE